ncbi:nucleotidyltransferase [Staphylococcus hominis]|uniref:nucleotidyltransferase domain-containing protein n=2 Tax=Staphylococcus TaxID=1279 RepID=UPI001F5972CE|nr:nucleotidyltransferase [Staphylococcus hominis]MCI2871117.1 nucleotidyltransferase [Staphylococcus hominis]MCI2875365.1 nucleotidyltransferase [Staphylococcus hominis]
MLFSEEQLKTYTKPLSNSEKEKCKNAIKMIQKSLEYLGYSTNEENNDENDSVFSYKIKMNNPSNSYHLSIFIKGSYATNTNVRQNSDVDIAVVKEHEFSTEHRAGVTDRDYKFIESNVPPRYFKDEVEQALIKHFGNQKVKRGNKAIRINGNSYRIDADCVPCFRHRNYRNDFYQDVNNYLQGIAIYSDDGQKVINYPQQHIEKSIEKNKDTNYRYKKMVRIIKELRYQLIENQNENAKNTSSFGVEGLLWNIPNNVFLDENSLGSSLNILIDYLINNIYKLENFKEPNNILYLCTSYEKLNIYKNFILDLRKYYEYKGE